ncbi:hypothetical protein QFC20_005742 [Naganishia adeliensis]|uniref:Uncharacterized protein n=2 Tax=Naganishia adeliensis TaxID=92952 RepID=A0ACC2UUF0_9TREE|nr:hypothetical protein QFC20_007840 [Naganishia adeliensis]KAJ9099389.1 hypothetical protein QFC20_005742 [Naganishia adeliensis]
MEILDVFKDARRGRYSTSLIGALKDRAANDCDRNSTSAVAEPALQIDDIAPVPFDTDRESQGSEEDSSSCETFLRPSDGALITSCSSHTAVNSPTAQKETTPRFYHPPLSEENDDEGWMAWRERIDELLEEFEESEETELELGEEEQIREEQELKKSE